MEDLAKEELVDKERKENKMVWEREKEKLRKDHIDKWVVIFGGEIKAISPDYDEVKDLGLQETNHRFIFKVQEEQKEKVKGHLRRPMRNKE